VTKIIEFHPCTEEIALLVPPPKPAMKSVPEWYKKIPNYVENDGEMKVGVDHTGSPLVLGKTVKKCAPFLDALTCGYIQETWCDMYVEQIHDGLRCYYSSSPELFTHRHRPSHGIPSPDVFYPIEFVWRQPWIPKVPSGYSVLFTHPLNRDDLPFHTFSGIVDYDGFGINGWPNNYSFKLRSGFSGLIPVGTPMFQMIPIKRESWKTESFAYNENKFKKETYSSFKQFTGGYKKHWWKRKDYK
jgi:hypothetical protein